MPYIFDGREEKFISDFDVDIMSSAVENGYQIRPHRYDYETEDQFNKRAWQEYEQISKALMRKNPKAWKRWHEGPKVIQHPQNEWENIPEIVPMGGRADLASNIGITGAGSQNALSLPSFQTTRPSQNAMTVANFDSPKVGVINRPWERWKS